MKQEQLERKLAAVQPSPREPVLNRQEESLPNSAMLYLYGTSESGAMQDRLIERFAGSAPGRMQPQIPSAEREASKLSSGIAASTPEEVKAEMGSRMGADFSGIRFHTDSASQGYAQGIGARAYTAGSDIYFGQGGFDAQVAAHELVHTAQQGMAESAVSVESAPVGGVQMIPGFLKRIKEDWKYGRAQKAKSKGLRRKNAEMENTLSGIDTTVDRENQTGEYTTMSSTNRETFKGARKDRLRMEARQGGQGGRETTFQQLDSGEGRANFFRKNTGETFFSKLASGRLFSSSRNRKDTRAQGFKNAYALSQEEQQRLDSMNVDKGVLQSAPDERGRRSVEAQEFANERGMESLGGKVSGGRQMMGLYEMGAENETEPQKAARKTRNSRTFDVIGNAFGKNAMAESDLQHIVTFSAPIVAAVKQAANINPNQVNDIAWVRQNYSRLSNISSQSMLVTDTVSAAKAKMKTENEKTAFENRVFGAQGREAYSAQFVALQMLVKQMATVLEERSGYSFKGEE